MLILLNESLLPFQKNATPIKSYVHDLNMNTTHESMQSAAYFKASKLYDGESLGNVAGHPCVYQYLPPTSSRTPISPYSPRPLVVFIPGAAHLARIAYGVPSHPSHTPSDFLAHHLNDIGYPFLGISYPLESGETTPNAEAITTESSTSLMPPTAYNFRTSEWGKQAAEVTKKTIIEYHLSNDVVLISWSMGGRMVVPYTQHAKSLGLNVKTLFAFAASPGFQTSNPPRQDAEITKNGYAFLGGKWEEPFLKMIHIQQDECEYGREVLPDAIWRRDYFGHIPVSLTDWKLRSVKSKDDTHFEFVEDYWQSFIDSDTPNVANLPDWIVSMYANTVMDAKHTLGDRANWNYLLTQKIMSRVDAARGRLAKEGRNLTDEHWQQLVRLVHSLPDRLSQEMPGTHFFFLGSTGAQRAATTIHRFLRITDQLESELRDILGEAT